MASFSLRSVSCIVAGAYSFNTRALETDNSSSKFVKINGKTDGLTQADCASKINPVSFSIKSYYYTSDSLWKIWLVESIQSIHNSLWTWHDKCNICCRYCIYHVKFNVCLVTKPLWVFSSETEWLNASLLFLRMKKCIIKQLWNSVFAWYHE